MLLSLNVLFLGVSLVVLDATPVKLDEATSKLIETNYNQGLRSGANNRLAGRAKRESFPSYDGINKIPITLDDYSDVLPVPHPISSSKQDAFSLKSEDRTEVEESDSYQGIGAVSKKGYHSVLPPLHGDFPAPVSAPQPAVAISAPAPVKIEYDFPFKISAPAPAPVVVAAPAPVRIAAAPVHVVQISQVLAPARNVSEIPPKVTVQHPTKVSIKTVAAPAVPI